MKRADLIAAWQAANSAANAATIAAIIAWRVYDATGEGRDYARRLSVEARNAGLRAADARDSAIQDVILEWVYD